MSYTVLSLPSYTVMSLLSYTVMSLLPSIGVVLVSPAHYGTVLEESDDLVILGVTFDSKITFEKHLRSVSRAAS